MAYRMADYYLRLRRKYPKKQIHQVVIYLRETYSQLAYQTSYNSEQMHHSFHVIRLWEQTTETFMESEGLLPLAVLTKTSDATATLKEVAKIIDGIEDRKIKSNVSAATAIICGLALKKEVIQRLLRSEIMKESVIYQEILLEGKAEGKAEGLAEGLAKGEARGKTEGRIEERTQIARNMLLSGLEPDLIARLTGLTNEQIQQLR